MVGLPWEKAKQENTQQSGMEKMLRSMGLGEVLDMAKQLANAGTAQKIIAFADNLEPLMQRLERMEKMLEQIEFDTSARQRGLVEYTAGGLVRQLIPDNSLQRPNGDGALHPDDGDVHSGTETPA